MVSLFQRITAPVHRVVIMLVLTLVLGIMVTSRISTVEAAAIGGGFGNSPATLCPGSPMQTRFMNQWNSMIKSASGTVNPNGYLKVIGTDLIPYHSVETFMIEAPDQGHELSSETWSYMLWLTAQYASVTGDFSFYNNTWSAIEKYAIPSAADNPNGGYNPTSPSTYAGEYSQPNLYPAALNSGVAVGQDPFSAELSSTYGNNNIYGMHWIFDGDNFYGFGNHNDGTSQMAYMNTFQRGPQESTWETIPQPSWDTMKWGAKVGGTYQGFGPFFISGAGAAKYSYTNAPDADARSVQAAYLAQQAAVRLGANESTQNAKAAKLGDYLRYTLAEKSFKAIPCATMSGSCPGGTGKSSLHYLIAWYYAWGGDAAAGSWSWRIGDYAAHMGYQNPMAAFALSTDANFKPRSASGATDWATSLKRQLDFYQWLQSAEGAIAGGAEFGQVSTSGSYTAAPAGTPAFNGLTYVANPVYLDPGSNTWFGFQAWSMQRLAEYYYYTGNTQAGAIITKWANWVKGGTVFHFAAGTNGEDVTVASTISWSGAPAASFTSGSTQPGANAGLHVSIVNYGADMGTMASASNALTWFAAATQKWGTLDTAARDLAKRVLDDQWNNHRDAKGVTAPEARADYSRFHDPVFIPAGMSGTTPKCAPTDCLIPGATVKSIRPQYANDVDYSRVESAIAAGQAPVFTFHRFWGQTDVAMANSFWGQFFETCGTGTPVPTVPVITNTPVPTAVRSNTPVPTAVRSNTPVATAVRSNTPVATAVRSNTPVPTVARSNTPVPTVARSNTPVPTASGGACSPVTATITAPFSFDGAGTFCWKASTLGTYINSWNLVSLTVNGVSFSNVYAFVNPASGSPAIPPKMADGFWYFSYNSSVAWGHFEAK